MRRTSKFGAGAASVRRGCEYAGDTASARSGETSPETLGCRRATDRRCGALLPALDPTALGWKERDFYLAPDFYSAIFDWSGNCGTTAWWDGQIVGAYVQDDAGRVELIVPRDPGPAGRAALQAEAKRLEDWLDGEKVSPAYKPPLVTGDRTGPVSERLQPGPP